MEQRNKNLICLIIVTCMIFAGAFSVQKASAATTLTLDPSSGQVIVNTPVIYQITGGNASTTYDIYYDGATTSTTVITDVAGAATFTYTYVSTGNHILTIRMLTTHTVVGTSNVLVSDVVADMMPWIVLVVTLIVVFGVIMLVVERLGVLRRK